MSQYYFRTGNDFEPVPMESINVQKSLPVGNYIVKQNPITQNFYLQLVPQFTFGSKRYGDNIKQTERIVSTFMSRNSATGVMLSGEKGSGKSLLAKTISIECATLDIPTIIINQPYNGDIFNKFIQDIDQPAVILFDEFEKVYDDRSQENLLTLLDGVFPTKKLFILTCNDEYRIDSHMKNRPGRIFYMIKFKGVGESFIVEYCNDNLLNKTHINSICKFSTVFNIFNFDMLKALVEEMNRYDEDPKTAMELLNVKPEYSDVQQFKVELTISGIKVPDRYLDTKVWNGNPITENCTINYKTEWNQHITTQVTDNFSEDYWTTLIFNPHDLKSAMGGNTFIFQKNDTMMTLIKEQQKHFNFMDAF